MITINTETLRELILKTEPSFLVQTELSFNGWGTTRDFGGEFVWIWSKEKVRATDPTELIYLANKIIE